ncbi:MAG TPA: hypothetical protein VHY20_11340, partial [Pirellulales bacterium]|nr:hypothetical protein [Pirellulales bacterium]
NFEPQYDSSIPEDQRFYSTTPSGKFEILVNNPAVQSAWKLGSSYYLDASEVPAVEDPSTKAVKAAPAS